MAASSYDLNTTIAQTVQINLAGSGLVEASTPLQTCTKTITTKCRVRELCIKDESFRGSLHPDSSFKMLGGSYAVLLTLKRCLDLPPHSNWAEAIGLIIKRKLQKCVTIYTATDGNHGAAVSWAANELLQTAVVYMPKDSDVSRIDRIKGFGGTVIVTSHTYDDTVTLASQECTKNGGVLVQDTEPENCFMAPLTTMALWACKAGYTCICLELLMQYPTPPTHAFIQVGVGSFAAAIISCLAVEWPDTKFICVEPVEAACLHDSMRNGKRTTVPSDRFVFSAGLACHTVSPSAWTVLQRKCSACLLCAADDISDAMALLQSECVCSSGDSGAAVSVAALMHLSEQSREALCIDSNSRILCFNTEGLCRSLTHTNAPLTIPDCTQIALNQQNLFRKDKVMITSSL